MSAAEITLVVLAVLALAGFGLWRIAQRLDRLHQRELSSRATLDAQLVRRAEVAAALAESGTLDLASALIVGDAAWRAAVEARRLVGDDTGDPASTDDTRGRAESELTQALRAALGDTADQAKIAAEPEGADLLERLAQANYRVQLARRFHNDAVVQIIQIRGTALVRTFYLAGRARLPQTFEMDDDLTVRSEGARP
ncbi:hypothetical protein EXU48_12885 [Occultella glacieicola]|uniref:LemA family protein n=1 Tax=Occultella glacieicola TaxID=2518684 RepID=A0ABY2E1I1_9MICO|nr:hypothetical protein [Occultella glacieicola]TDE92455.1 hypothetical protein EXU48_12885 [Occultella glacieicola]